MSSGLKTHKALPLSFAIFSFEKGSLLRYYIVKRKAMMSVSRREIIELFLEKYYLPEAATVKAANAIDWIEKGVYYKELIRIESLRDMRSFMIRHIVMALKEDVKEDFIKEDLFKAFGKEFIIDGTKVNKDDGDSYKLILEILFSAKEVREIIERKAREIMAIKITMLKEKRGEVIYIYSIDIDNLYEIWKIELGRIGHEELKQFLEEIEKGAENIESMEDFERILADRIAVRLEKDIEEDFPELVLELFGEGVMFEDAKGRKVELDWDNVYQIIPSAIKGRMEEPVNVIAQKLMEESASRKRKAIEQTLAPILAVKGMRHISL